jgi:hypothetical protein
MRWFALLSGCPPFLSRGSLCQLRYRRRITLFCVRSRRGRPNSEGKHPDGHSVRSADESSQSKVSYDRLTVSSRPLDEQAAGRSLHDCSNTPSSLLTVVAREECQLPRRGPRILSGPLRHVWPPSLVQGTPPPCPCSHFWGIRPR